MTEQAKIVARRLREEYVSTGNRALVDELLAPDFRYCGPPSLGAEPSDRERFTQLIAAYRQAFPDLRETVEDQHIDGDHVVQRTTSRGTFTAEMMGMSPTGKAYEIPGVDIIRVLDERIVEVRAMFDSLGLMQQTGMCAP